MGVMLDPPHLTAFKGTEGAFAFHTKIGAWEVDDPLYHLEYACMHLVWFASGKRSPRARAQDLRRHHAIRPKDKPLEQQKESCPQTQQPKN